MSTKQNAIYALGFVGALIAATAPAAAAVSASSSAYGVKANVNILSNSVVAVAELGKLSGTAPAAYDKNRTVVGLDQHLLLSGGLLASAYEDFTTGVITTTARSGVPGTIDASSSATIDGMDLTFRSKALFGIVPVLSLGIDADAITSSTAVGVGPSGLWSSGSSNLADINITGGLLGLLNLDFDVLANAAANTRIDLAGISIIVNEQQETRTGTTDIFRFTNALHISLDDYVLGGRLLNGDIIVGHSEASIAGYAPVVTSPGAVPEPATWAMMILGFGMVGAATRQRRTRLARVTA